MAAWTPSRVDADGGDDDSSRGGYSYRDAEFYPPVEGERGESPAGVKSFARGPASRFLVNPLAVAARRLRDWRERRAAARRDVARVDRDARESAAAERLRARRETLSGARGAFLLARAVEASRGALLSALDRACDSANLDDAGLRPGDVLVPAARGGAVVAAFAPPAGRSPSRAPTSSSAGTSTSSSPTERRPKRRAKRAWRSPSVRAPSSRTRSPRLSRASPTMPRWSSRRPASESTRARSTDSAPREDSASPTKPTRNCERRRRRTSPRFARWKRRTTARGRRGSCRTSSRRRNTRRGVSSRAWATPKMRFASSFEARWSRRVSTRAAARRRRVAGWEITGGRRVGHGRVGIGAGVARTRGGREGKARRRSRFVGGGSRRRSRASARRRPSLARFDARGWTSARAAPERRPSSVGESSGSGSA